MQYSRVEKPVSLQEIHISKTGGATVVHILSSFSVAGTTVSNKLSSNSSSLPIRTSHFIQVLARATVSNITISNFAPPPITSSNEVAKVLARAGILNSKIS